MTEKIFDPNELANAITHMVLKSLRNEGVRLTRNSSPCDACAYNPPSSFDGKPCAICPAIPIRVEEDI